MSDYHEYMSQVRQLAVEMQERETGRQQRPDLPHQLIRLSHHNPIVARTISQWRCGEFASLEQALIACILILSEEQQRLLDLVKDKAAKKVRKT